MSVARRTLQLLTRAGTYIVYFGAMNAALAASMLIEMSWVLVHPGNATSSSA